MSDDSAFPLPPAIVDTRNETAVVVATALQAAKPTVLAEDTSYAFVTGNGTVEIVHGQEPRLAPPRKLGTCRLLDATSFAVYYLKHYLPGQSEIYADPTAPTIVGVLNGNGPTGDADVEDLGFGDHRVELTFRHTPAWKRWAALDSKLVPQTQFAEHLEASLPDVVEPDGAQLLELAQSFQAKTRVHFESAKDLGSGQRQLVYREEVQASAGVKGDITIPREFVIGIAPYEGAGLYRLTARLRYRINDGHLSIGYALDRPEDVLRAAFDDVLKQVQEETDRTALLGTPPA